MITINETIEKSIINKSKQCVWGKCPNEAFMIYNGTPICKECYKELHPEEDVELVAVGVFMTSMINKLKRKGLIDRDA